MGNVIGASNIPSGDLPYGKLEEKDTDTIVPIGSSPQQAPKDRYIVEVSESTFWFASPWSWAYTYLQKNPMTTGINFITNGYYEKLPQKLFNLTGNAAAGLLSGLSFALMLWGIARVNNYWAAGGTQLTREGIKKLSCSHDKTSKSSREKSNAAGEEMQTHLLIRSDSLGVEGFTKTDCGKMFFIALTTVGSAIALGLRTYITSSANAPLGPSALSFENDPWYIWLSTGISAYEGFQMNVYPVVANVSRYKDGKNQYLAESGLTEERFKTQYSWYKRYISLGLQWAAGDISEFSKKQKTLLYVSTAFTTIGYLILNISTCIQMQSMCGTAWAIVLGIFLVPGGTIVNGALFLRNNAMTIIEYNHYRKNKNAVEQNQNLSSSCCKFIATVFQIVNVGVNAMPLATTLLQRSSSLFYIPDITAQQSLSALAGWQYAVFVGVIILTINIYLNRGLLTRFASQRPLLSPKLAERWDALCKPKT